MRKFLPFFAALGITALALGITLFVVRPNVRSFRVPVEKPVEPEEATT